MTSTHALAPGDKDKCVFWDAICQAKRQVGNATDQFASSALDQFADSFAKSSIEILKYLTTFWINPQIGDDGEAFGRLFSPRIKDGDPTDFLAFHTGWLVTWVAVLGLLLAAGRMAWLRRGEPFREAMSGMVTLTLVVAVVSQGTNLALESGDEYSKWILERATQGDVQGKLVAATEGLAAVGAPGVVLIVAVLAVLSSVAQLVMMFIRGTMLILLVGAMPLAAAATI
ncbi:hypothetical protein ACSNOI_39245, partial [Actinomadura kijaniata]